MDINATARAILLQMRAKVEAGPEGGLYGDRGDALYDLDVLLANLSTPRVKRLLMPTGNLQELSIECGWGDEFNQLAAALEKVLGIA
jgi:hypothetical protein